MSPELNTQLYGIGLAILTAVGCIAYERLVKSLPYTSVCFFVWMEYFWIWICLLIFQNDSAVPEISYWKANKWAITIFLLSGLTSPLWYWIVRRYSVLVGGVFEIKYIIILGILAVLFGQQKPTVNTWVGTILAILSVYFISKK